MSVKEAAVEAAEKFNKGPVDNLVSALRSHEQHSDLIIWFALVGALEQIAARFDRQGTPSDQFSKLRAKTAPLIRLLAEKGMDITVEELDIALTELHGF